MNVDATKITGAEFSFLHYLRDAGFISMDRAANTREVNPTVGKPEVISSLKTKGLVTVNASGNNVFSMTDVDKMVAEVLAHPETGLLRELLAEIGEHCQRVGEDIKIDGINSVLSLHPMHDYQLYQTLSQNSLIVVQSLYSAHVNKANFTVSMTTKGKGMTDAWKLEKTTQKLGPFSIPKEVIKGGVYDGLKSVIARFVQWTIIGGATLWLAWFVHAHRAASSTKP